MRKLIGIIGVLGLTVSLQAQAMTASELVASRKERRLTRLESEMR